MHSHIGESHHEQDQRTNGKDQRQSSDLGVEFRCKQLRPIKAIDIANITTHLKALAKQLARTLNP